MACTLSLTSDESAAPRRIEACASSRVAATRGALLASVVLHDGHVRLQRSPQIAGPTSLGPAVEPDLELAHIGMIGRPRGERDGRVTLGSPVVLAGAYWIGLGGDGLWERPDGHSRGHRS